MVRKVDLNKDRSLSSGADKTEKNRDSNGKMKTDLRRLRFREKAYVQNPLRSIIAMGFLHCALRLLTLTLLSAITVCRRENTRALVPT